MLRAAIDWRRREPQRKKDLLLSSALSERIKEDELLVRGPAQDALLAEHALTLTKEDESNLFAKVMEANPKAAANVKDQERESTIQVGLYRITPCSNRSFFQEELSRADNPNRTHRCAQRDKTRQVRKILAMAAVKTTWVVSLLS